ncbi:MAG: chemotaxis protein CheA [Verrucomicrobiales bacterium]|nr:chemotaxis protein CheA [Verrucomicrobiales bacterium]
MSQPNPAITFLQEADDLLGLIEEVALEVDPLAPDAEDVNRLFRAFHTIKGSGAMFGFDAVAAFTHHVETALDRVREGQLGLSQELIGLVLAAKDHIKFLLDPAPAPSSGSADESGRIIASLNGLWNPGGASVLRNDTLPAPPSATIPPPPTGIRPRESFQIQFRPDPALLLSGTSPVALLKELLALGDGTLVAKLEEVPELALLQPDQCHFAWDIHLSTDKGLNAIQDVFIFVQDGSTILIEPVPPSAKGALMVQIPETSPRAASQPNPAATAPALGRTEGRSASTPKTSAVPTGVGARKAPGKDNTVRVPSEKLDHLVNLVGELVMNQSRLSQAASRFDSPDLAVPVEEIERLVSELRDDVLGIRMMPIGSTFNRFKRLVHDLSAELGKEIDLLTEGAETELDKTVLDQLGDPLVHLIRNSLDHGIEAADVRQKRGKPRRGTIRLAAAHTGSNVVVTIQDDGKGLDTAAIRAKAVEKQLIPADASLSDKEIFNLIFLPGFSTAQQVTSISGRGVGMDVVKRQIDALRGSVSIASEVGVGTTIALTLPLTLAIIDGLLVELGGDQFIIPMSIVTENVELLRHERSRNNGRNVVAIRGELVPYLRLREVFDVRSAELDLEKIVIVRHEDQRVGLVVDRVLGSHQTVIQSLGRFYRNVGIVSGATIMGDGRVALILDLVGLIQSARTRGAGPAQRSSSAPHLGTSPLP